MIDGFFRFRANPKFEKNPLKKLAVTFFFLSIFPAILSKCVPEVCVSVSGERERVWFLSSLVLLLTKNQHFYTHTI